MTTVFPCDKCGLCCRHVNRIELAEKGGVCKYLDLNSNLCSIYEHRPLFCRVDDYYEKYYQDEMTREDFYKLNLEYCKRIKEFWQKDVI